MDRNRWIPLARLALAWSLERAASLLALASVGVLGAALFFQHVIGLQPCELCILQRWGVLACGAAALGAVACGRRTPARRGLLALAGLACLATMAIAGYHVGVEQHWWYMPGECAATAGAGATSLDALRNAVLAAKPVSCDVVQWSLFGVSMAGWNIPVSLAMAAFAFAGAVRRPR